MVLVKETGPEMFWGIKLEPGKKYTQTVEASFHISMAALELSNAGGEPTSVMISHNDAEFVLCSLSKGQALQQALDLNFVEGESLTLYVNGKGSVHLTGYRVFDETEEGEPRLDQLMDEDLSEDLSEEDSDELEEEIIGKKRKLDTLAAGDAVNKKSKLSAALDEVDDSEDDSDDEDFLEQEAELSGEEDSDEEEESDDEDDEDDEEEYSDEEGDSDDDDESVDEEQIKELMAELEREKAKAQAQKKDAKPTNGQKNPQSPKKEKKPQTPKQDKKEQKTPKSEPKKPQDKTPNVKQAKQTPKSEPKPVKNQTPKTDKSVKNQSPKSDKNQSPKSEKNQTPKQDKNQTPKQDKKQEKKQKTPNTATTPQQRKLPSGISLADLKSGHGPDAKQGRMVHVYYKGALENGKVFDSKLSGNPFKFRLGKNEVIKGWELGVQGMKVGGKRTLSIPPNLAYGSQKIPGIPPNSTLNFEIELKNIS